MRTTGAISPCPRTETFSWHGEPEGDFFYLYGRAFCVKSSAKPVGYSREGCPFRRYAERVVGIQTYQSYGSRYSNAPAYFLEAITRAPADQCVDVRINGGKILTINEIRTCEVVKVRVVCVDEWKEFFDPRWYVSQMCLHAVTVESITDGHKAALNGLSRK